jgi:hypothetical protein
MPAVHTLVGIVLKAPLHEALAYETAQMRRKAASALIAMLNEKPQDIFAVFEEHGVRTMEDLKLRTSHLPVQLVSDMELGFALM